MESNGYNNFCNLTTEKINQKIRINECSIINIFEELQDFVFVFEKEKF